MLTLEGPAKMLPEVYINNSKILMYLFFKNDAMQGKGTDWKCFAKFYKNMRAQKEITIISKSFFDSQVLQIRTCSGSCQVYKASR